MNHLSGSDGHIEGTSALEKWEADLNKRYARLTPAQKQKFPDCQNEAVQLIKEYIEGKRNFESLTPSETRVIDKIKIAYLKFKAMNTGKTFAGRLQDPHENRIYINLIQRLAFEILLKREAQPNEQTEYTTFRIKSGETQEGVYWIEYNNIAAKNLKASKKFEWGKERIYFDIPLADMEKLRDLVIKIAGMHKIPVGFKYLDVTKTDKVYLRPNDDVSRFVANFASAEDAKKFYTALNQNPQYQAMSSDRNLDHHGHNIDGVAHYANGFRERREPLKRIIENAKRNQDGTYSYPSVDGSRQVTISEKEYREFVSQFKALPDPKKTWESIK